MDPHESDISDEELKAIWQNKPCEQTLPNPERPKRPLPFVVETAPGSDSETTASTIEIIRPRPLRPKMIFKRRSSDPGPRCISRESMTSNSTYTDFKMLVAQAQKRRRDKEAAEQLAGTLKKCRLE